MHNSRDVTICVLSDLMRPPVFVKLNAIEGVGWGAFTFSIFSTKKNEKFSETALTSVIICHIIISIQQTPDWNYL